MTARIDIPTGDCDFAAGRRMLSLYGFDRKMARLDGAALPGASGYI